ncbi:MAG: hypothetical protein RIE73_02570 [Coleofasciculus sp. C1-SOL-03]|jgi:hypothetical protein|uniref:hypothetical protein n=1 Tax=Coleofasciculus sp. C1-SOL-03 TaxID=3069522 RepID=UPI0032FC8C39
MQITINIPKDLEQRLIQQATQLNIPLESFILQSLRQLTQTTQNKVACWSDTILSYKGDPDFPAFESYRDELLPPREPELF